MWIIPNRFYDTYPCVQDTLELTSDLGAFCQTAEQSLMWRSKPSLSKTWLTRLKRKSWMQRLFTRTLKPSRSKNFVDAWTSYLVGFPVNRFQMLGQSNQQKIRDISFPTSLPESKSANPQLSFLRMSKASSQAKQEMENPFSSMSLEAWKKWVTEQRQEYSQRQKLARHINESASLSWPTARTSDAVETYENWPTPAAHEPRLGYQNRNNGKKGTQKSLTTIVIDGLQDQTNPNTNGKNRVSLKLNPNWVEQLMGLPVGWTQIKTEQTD